MSLDTFSFLCPNSPLARFIFSILLGATCLLHGSQELAVEVHDRLFSPSLKTDTIVKRAAATRMHVCDIPPMQEQYALTILSFVFENKPKACKTHQIIYVMIYKLLSNWRICFRLIWDDMRIDSAIQ